MTRHCITPPNEAAWLALRILDVTSTESSALFGLNHRLTAFELWHHKHDKTEVEFEPNERVDWGNDLQDAIAASLARRYGVKAVRITDYMRIADARMGASFDFEIVEDMAAIEPRTGKDDILRSCFERMGPGLLEIKNVDSLVFRDAWLDKDGFLEAPGHIEIQLQHQLHVREREWGAIGVLVGGNKGRLLVRERDHAVGEKLEARIAAFWRSVDAGEEPAPQFPQDADFVRSLYKVSRADAVFDGRGNADLDAAIDEYADALKRETLAEEDKKVAQAKCLQIIGDAERAYTDRYTISAKMVAACDISYTRNAYRGWKVTAKKVATMLGKKVAA